MLADHPAIAASAVVGCPTVHGEAVKAYVVTRPGIPIEEEDVIAFCAERLPGYKCPSKVWFVDDIPRGLTGKTLRFALREQEGG